MNNEFKKLSQGDVTRYVLESASGGGTSSGSVASVSMPMGGTRKRGDNLIAQEADKNTVPASTPRNFVAKNAKTAGAGAHKDKSKTIPRKEKHKKPYMEDHSTATGGWGQGSYDTYTAGNHGRGVAEDEEYDDEAGMADNNIETMKRAVDGLDSLIHKGDNLPEWCQEKIAVAKSMLVTVWDYMASEEQGVAEGSIKDVEAKIRTHDQRKADREQAGDPYVAHEIHSHNVIRKQLLDKRKRAQAAYQKKMDQQDVAEGAEKRCMQCGMKNCTCAPGKCKCKPVAGWVPGKGFKKAMDEAALNEKWSEKYKSSINCSHPKGFSQKAHCAGKKKHNEDMTMEAVCPDCGMCQTHGDNMMEIKQRLDAKCWTGKHKEGTKIKGGVRVNNCVPNEDIEEGAKVDRQAKHITASMMKKGKSKKDAESIAWAHIKHPKNESVDPYFESLDNMLERQLEPTMDLDTWNNNFQNADPNKYHQFKNKTPEKKK